MSNHRTKSNDTLRQRIKDFLKTKASGETFHINTVVTALSRLNKNYTLNPQRLTNLLKELDNIARPVESGVWVKL
jgi:hypothetical protein